MFIRQKAGDDRTLTGRHTHVQPRRNTAWVIGLHPLINVTWLIRLLLFEQESQIHVDDCAFIGSALGAIVVPAIFLRRAALPNLVLGGATLGLGSGVIAHLVQWKKAGEDITPKGMVAEVDVGKVTRKL